MENGVPTGSDMPCQAFDFEDVTSIFEQAAAEMEEDEVILAEEFSLQEAMSGLEIGEPRLDTGTITLQKPEGQPSFHPLRPLLPEEVCWILDQAMAYEMEFHAGNFLAHTVYTLLYVHHLDDISPEIVMKWHPSFKHDHSRPLALITIVLRTAVQALLKCVDLSWRELAKGGMYDAEDWQSDKCEVNVLEAVPEKFILQRLDSAVRFVSESPYIPGNWKSALISRLLLRQSILQLLSIDIVKHRNEFMQTILRARNHLRVIKSSPVATPAPLSAAALAFDPYVGRKLLMVTPIRIVTPPSFGDACVAVERFLDGLFETSLLTCTDNLTTWQAMTDLQLWLPNSKVHLPYVRSLGQSSFYDGKLILKRHNAGWILNRFFYESCGKNYDFLRSTLLERWKGEDSTHLLMLEKTVHRLVAPHVQALFSNPPRRRRYFMKHLTEWHRLYEILMEIQNNIDLDVLPRCDILAYLPDTALLWRFSIIREIVLSGFQLELYLGEEIPFAYWYSANVIDEHLKCLDNISSTVLPESGAYSEMRFQFEFLTLLQSLCTSLFLATIRMISLDLERRPNFTRRYKWAFDPEYATSFELSPLAQPDVQQYLRECDEVLTHIDDYDSEAEAEATTQDRSDGSSSSPGIGIEDGDSLTNFQYPSEYVELAKSIGEEMQRKNDLGAWAGVWAKERAELIRQLCIVCTDLASLPTTRREMNVFDARKRLSWEPGYNPWFPRLLPCIEKGPLHVE